MMFFVNYDYGDEGERGCGFFEDIEVVKKKMLDESMGFFVYHQDGVQEHHNESGEMIARYKE
jgi:hypothetical protein